jgi:ubiquinone/menaquinone biosynthesis C-methylase UbiE
MTAHECIRIFDSQGAAYKEAFQIFLDHTDQKRNARRWLQQVVDTLPTKRIFIDAGAGNGEVTKAFAGAFARTIAIEPNLYLLKQLQQALPSVEAIALPILTAQSPAQADLVLCSHTFYYIPQDQWLEHLERLVSWMSPTGVTIVVLQNPETSCMNMLHHFFGHRFDLRRTVEAFQCQHRDRYRVVITTDPAHVDTPDLVKAYAVAEFMLNLLEMAQTPSRREVEAYLEANFKTQDGRYRIPVHQDFIEIRHGANSPHP